MAQLGVEVTSKLEAVLTEWPNVYKRTKEKILTMRSYYSNPSNRSAVVARTDADREALKEDLDQWVHVYSHKLPIQTAERNSNCLKNNISYKVFLQLSVFLIEDRENFKLDIKLE